MKKVMFVLLVLIIMVGSTFAGEKCCKANAKDVEAVKKVIEAAYVNGIHINRDLGAIKKGFHPEFTMMIKSEKNLKKVAISDWMKKIEAWKQKEPTITTKTKHKFTMVNVAGNAAVARIEIMKDGKHVYTDFMSLYKFDDGWKIVNKIFQSYKKHMKKKKK